MGGTHNLLLHEPLLMLHACRLQRGARVAQLLLRAEAAQVRALGLLLQRRRASLVVLCGCVGV